MYFNRSFDQFISLLFDHHMDKVIFICHPKQCQQEMKTTYWRKISQLKVILQNKDFFYKLNKIIDGCIVYIYLNAQKLDIINQIIP